MDGMLLDSPLSSDYQPELAVLVRQLLSEVAELRAELARLRGENLELRQQAGYWKSRHADAVRRLAALQQEIDLLQGENRKLQAERFGRRSEKQSGSDRSNQLDDPADAQPKRKRGQQPDRPAPQRRDYSHLPAREQFIDLPESEQICPCCGLPLNACGTEDSEQLEIETSVFRRVLRRRRYQRTCCCPGPRTLTAPPAPKRQDCVALP